MTFGIFKELKKKPQRQKLSGKTENNFRENLNFSSGIKCNCPGRSIQYFATRTWEPSVISCNSLPLPIFFNQKNLSKILLRIKENREI